VTWKMGGWVGCSSWRRRGVRRRPWLLFGEVREDAEAGVEVRVGAIPPLSAWLI
jgi:hypothetical protein